MKICKPIEVELENLLLDPNNPRLVLDLNPGEPLDDTDFEGAQERILAQFSSSGRPEANEIDIKDLDASMRKLGYIGIDKIVVRRLDNSNKWIVIEGNRRVSTMKKLVNEFERNGEQESLTTDKVETFLRLKVMELITDGIDKEVLDERISVILGLRHHGSLLEWEPLPKAHNIYVHYMEISEGDGQFSWNRDRGKTVASVLSIRLPEVQQSLRTYVAYLQLKERSEIDSRYYSLISAAVTNRKLVGHKYFDIDDTSFRLTDESFDRLYNICQFEDRGNLRPGQIIIPKPQMFSQLGNIVETVYRSKQQTVRVFASALLSDIEAGDFDPENNYSLKVNLEAAWLELKAFAESIEWVESLEELLKKQEDELDFDDYHVEGNDRRAKDQLANLLVRFKAILDVD